MTISNALLVATTEQLIEELNRRGALAVSSATVLMDGRQIAAARDTGLTDRQIEAHLEVRALEVMSRAMAAAKLSDRVHSFEVIPAHGDYPPGTVRGRVQMLNVQTRGLGG